MNSFEKYEKMLSLEPYKDRSEMPVFPMMVATYGSLGGVSQKEICSDPDKWILAIENTIAKIGKPDVSMAMYPLDTTFVMGLPVRLPGRELGDDDLYQFVESPYFDDTSEYDKIMGMSWEYWYGGYLMSIQNPPFTNPQQIGERYGILGANLGKTIGYLISKGIVPCFESATGPIFDTLSMIRGMADFTYDLCDEPEKIVAIMEKYQPIEDEKTIGMMKATGGRKLGIFAMRSSATFISPTMFEELVWPTLKASIIRYHQAGLVSVLHADANWLPMVKYFTELPKGCLHLELDGDTDIEQAYDILRGWQSIRGDVPATMLAYGTPDEVAAYSEKLVQMGMKGGFMLSSGCEVPLNAKLENVKAMMDVMK
ncbi:MAG: hypothetical protein IJJ17_06280 [Parasporobacterium sp.]|nr:hypothetical protein [Parasporobacterium sp.]